MSVENLAQNNEGILTSEEIKLIHDAVLAHPLDQSGFTIAGIHFDHWPAPYLNSNGTVNEPPATYHARSRNSVEIIIWEDLPEKVRRAILFHEVVECMYLIKVQWGDENRAIAHNYAINEEKSFISGLDLSPEEKLQLESIIARRS